MIAYLVETKRIDKAEAYQRRHADIHTPTAEFKPHPAQGKQLRIVGKIEMPRIQQKSRFPLTMVIPPDRAREPGLALPDGQWQRLPDGAIEVTFNTVAQLETCLTATAALREAIAQRSMT